ncbi:glucose-1-phosphate thymidylyltransferase [Streptomyces sp. NA04227]|uniref:glucose-1-phosphate thymidylyltransferase n=1 Tax=Streptomyces sp. NA04227 TaxID=2742136 RepID=UPI001590F2BA|nr:glucose-1-phosphate thymidylyltransferase [Streptomyces sp. NA04227]QKW08022.1 glucose-1-phosphate thymidylyltransferase [Streptomyces sp. NA04227]
MKALVLAGGSGTRLRPLTHTSAKQLVPVANKPVLYYGLESLAAAGITEVGVIVGATGAEIRAAVGDGSRFGLSVTYIPQEAPLGLAHAVLIARDFLGEDDFVMFLGDNFIVGGITEVTEAFRTGRPDSQILVTKVPDPSAFGVVELDEDGRVRALEEKPRFPKSDLALVGVFFFTPVVHRAVRAIEPSPRGELEITDALQWLVDEGHEVRSQPVTGYWKDTGNANDMLDVNRTVLDTLAPRVEGLVDTESELTGNVVVEPGARIVGSRIVGPAIIGAGATVVGSRIGPYTSIAADCRIEDSDVEYSIVLQGARVCGVRPVHSSLIGREATVGPAATAPGAHRLIVGDHSRVQICA